jgi:propanol-preferring alcohol dehydrogenase
VRALVYEGPGRGVVLRNRPVPEPGPGRILIRVRACGVCRTDLHIVDGELTEGRVPIIPGHEIVGVVASAGRGVEGFPAGTRVGVPWLGSTCGTCGYCTAGRENLCDSPGFTGYTIDGGFAEYTLADPRYCFPLPGGYDDAAAAPLLCAGLIGYRSYRMARMEVQEGRGRPFRLGLYGFGAAAHIIIQVARREGAEVHVFTRPGDEEGQAFARELGAAGAEGSDAVPVETLDAAIIFAPVGNLVPAALRAVRKGGTVVCAGIHMSDIPSFPYRILWEERVLRSVANLTRRDGVDFLSLAPQVPVKTRVSRYPLEEGARALDDLRSGRVKGAAVLVMG